MTSSACSMCGADCPHGGMSFAQKHPLTKEWMQWRLCKACAKREGDLQDERSVVAIREAERSGV